MYISKLKLLGIVHMIRRTRRAVRMTHRQVRHAIVQVRHAIVQVRATAEDVLVIETLTIQEQKLLEEQRQFLIQKISKQINISRLHFISWIADQPYSVLSNIEIGFIQNSFPSNYLFIKQIRKKLMLFRIESYRDSFIINSVGDTNSSGIFATYYLSQSDFEQLF